VDLTVTDSCAPSIATYPVSAVGEVSLREAAQLASVPYRTLARWCERWHYHGVPGVRRVAGRARAGRRWAIDRSVIDRWLACELPTPTYQRR